MEGVGQYWRGGKGIKCAVLRAPARMVEISGIEGAALETIEIRDVLAVVDRAAEWREIALHPPQSVREWPAIEQLSRGILDFTDFLRFFRKKILPDGTLDDRASPELSGIRREI